MNSIVRRISSCAFSNVPILQNNLLRISGSKVEATRCYSHYYPGEKQYDMQPSIEYDVTKDPEEWKYVARLLPSKWIRDPEPKDSYPSGWKPPDPAALSQPYYVRRTKNHMIPVYLHISHRGIRRLTFIRYIQGDIWLLHDEIKKHIEEKCGKEIGIRVDEVTSKLIIKGDHVHYATEWLKEKGF